MTVHAKLTGRQLQLTVRISAAVLDVSVFRRTFLRVKYTVVSCYFICLSANWISVFGKATLRQKKEKWWRYCWRFTSQKQDIYPSDGWTLLLHRRCQRPCAYGCAELKGSSISCHSLELQKRSFQPLHQYKSYVQQCMLRQDKTGICIIRSLNQSLHMLIGSEGVPGYGMVASSSQLKNNWGLLGLTWRGGATWRVYRHSLFTVCPSIHKGIIANFTLSRITIVRKIYISNQPI